MIRTQIYLDNEQVQKISVLAKKQKTEKAKIIRALIQKGLDSEKKSGAVREGLLGLADLGKKLKMTGPTDLSVRLDDYLYNE